LCTTVIILQLGVTPADRGAGFAAAITAFIEADRRNTTIDSYQSTGAQWPGLHKWRFEVSKRSLIYVKTAMGKAAMIGAQDLGVRFDPRRIA